MRVATHSNKDKLDADESGQDTPSSDDASSIDFARAAEAAKAWVHEHPLAALGVAAAAGFLVGRLVRR